MQRVMVDLHKTQQNSYYVSNLQGTVTTLWLDSDSVVTVANCRHWQHSDYTTIGSSVTVLPVVLTAGSSLKKMVTILSLSSHCVYGGG